MLTASMRLTGILDDGAEGVRSYYLVADFDEHGSGTPAVIPLSLGAPMPDDECLRVSQGGEEAALNAAVEAIKSLPGNRGLEVRVAINPE